MGDHSDAGYDVQALLGKCTLESLAYSLSVNKFRLEIPVDLTTITLPVGMQLVEWDQQFFSLDNDESKLNLGISVHLDTQIDKKLVEIFAKIKGWIQFTKKPTSESSGIQLNTSNLKEDLITYQMRISIEQLDDVVAPNIPERFLGWLKDGLLQLSGPFDIKIPKICVKDKLCIDDLDIVFKKNSII